MPTATKAKLALPLHVEDRRAEILNALHLRALNIKHAHTRVIEVMRVLNGAIGDFNRVLDHCDGWAIEAVAVIDHNVIRNSGPDFVSTPEGQAVLDWIDEINQTHFDRVPLVQFIAEPDTPQIETLNAIPRYPDKPKPTN